MDFLRIFACFLCIFLTGYTFSAEENFLLINGVTDEIVLELGPHIDEQISPCSSFKMALSVMGYDAGILQDEATPTWDFKEGYDDWLASWRVPQTPLSWMRTSCIWYAKVLALQIGREKMQTYLTALQYGNQDMSGGLPEPGPIDPMWINSSLKISPRQQVVFIQKMIRGTLPVSKNTIEKTKVLVFKEELSKGWKLFGKTGCSGSDVTRDGKTLQHSWFVGWIEKDEVFFPFAFLNRDKTIDLDQRIPRVKQLLENAGVIQ